MNPLFSDSMEIDAFLIKYPLFAYHKNEIYQFYKNRKYAFAWFNESGFIEQGANFMNLLSHFDDEGLKDSVIYLKPLTELFNLIGNPDYQFKGKDENTLETDLLMTSEFFVYAQKVWGGMNENQTNNLSWYIKRKTIPYVSILDSILSGKRKSFTAYEPVYSQYNLLKNYLKIYRNIAQQNAEWDSIKLPADVKFYEYGDSSETIALIKKRLQIFGDLDSAYSGGNYDTATVWAVKNFQKRFGLKEDGSAGKNFLNAINIKPTELVNKIELNMERCRWVPYDLHGDYITVNIPEFKMHIYSNDTLDWSMNVIVGKSSTSTIIFNDEMEYIVFSPYWVITPSIIANEILPALKKNPAYLSRNNMELYSRTTQQTVSSAGIDFNKYNGSNFPYGVRQLPGPQNSLGWVKFIFPNSYNIYFHDTPSRNLFTEMNRTFSHGCIRLAEPQRFAEYLLRNDTSWTITKIDSVMHSGKEKKVSLKKPLPVFIAYFTAWVDDSGAINFRNDVYNHDKKLEETLSQTQKIISFLY